MNQETKQRVKRYKKDHLAPAKECQAINARLQRWSDLGISAAKRGDMKRARLYKNAVRRAHAIMLKIREAQAIVYG